MNRVLALVVAIILSAGSTALADDSGATTYARIEPSLALVAAGRGKDLGFGSAFCISNLGDNSGLLLTNQHVVAHDPNPRVILMSSPNKVLAASVIRTSSLDAAVLLIPSGCQPLQLSSGAPAVGTKVALAGFPSIQLRAALAGLGLSPSFHEGTISAILASGSELEYDAQTDHGNSGSPLFDIGTGTVYGLVTSGNTGETGALQNNFALSVAALAAFLQNAHAAPSYVTQNAPMTGEAAAQQGASLPSFTAQSAASSLPQAAGAATATADPAITELVRLEFTQWQAGAINKSLYAPEVLQKLSDASIGGTAQALARLGSVTDVVYVGPWIAPDFPQGARGYIYQMRCVSGNVYLWLALNKEGKIATIFFKDSLDTRR